MSAKLTTAVVALLLMGTLASAQTTGFPGFNDYTVNGLGSGSTSCTPISLTSPTSLDFEISATPGTTAYFMFSFFPCTPASILFPTCQGTTFDLRFPPIPYMAGPYLVGTSGTASYSVPLPPMITLTFATQVYLMCPFAPLSSQAYDVSVTP